MVVVDLAFERRVNDCYESVLTVDSCSMSTRKQHSHDDLTENDDRYSSHWPKHRRYTYIKSRKTRNFTCKVS